MRCWIAHTLPASATSMRRDRTASRKRFSRRGCTREVFRLTRSPSDRSGVTRYVGAWRLDAPTHEIKDLSVDALRRQLLESRAVLGGWLRLYQVHSATLESGVLDDRQVLNELIRLRSDGLVVGLTVSGPRQAETSTRTGCRDRGVNPFQCVQATWNLLEPSAGPALARAHARGWGVIVKEVLANGRLTDDHADPRITPLEEHARSVGAPLDAVAFAAALGNPWVDVVLSGAVTEGQLLTNLRSLDITMDQNALPVVAQLPEEYLDGAKQAAMEVDRAFSPRCSADLPASARVANARA